MRKKVYQVMYWSNPNLPLGYDHTGRLDNLSSISTKTFEHVDDAIEFWSQCTKPITKLSSFKKDVCKQHCLTEDEVEEILLLTEENATVMDEADLEIHPIYE